jgi:chromate transporter
MNDGRSATPGLRDLCIAWLRVSVQSFGGGAATLNLIRREFVTRTGWISDAEFTRDWSMCQLAPGINLIALCILIGKRTGGTLAILVAMTGLLVPSFAITLALTAAYSRFIHTAAVTSAMKGVLPAVAGIGLATGFGMAVPIVRSLWAKDRIEMAVYSSLFIVCLALTLTLHVPTIQVLVGAGAFGSTFNVFWRRHKGDEA